MEEHALYSATLGLHAPWRIVAVCLGKGEGRLDITIDVVHGSTFACPRCGKRALLSNQVDEIWYHDDFFRYRAYLHARVPHVACRFGCGTNRIPVPWARAGSRFMPVTEN